MIRRYNRYQIFRAVLCLAGGLFCYFLAWLFFRHVPVLIAYQFRIPFPERAAVMVAALGLAAVSFSGYRSWRAGGGLQGYHESALYHDLGEETAGAFIVDFYAHRITGPAHILSQVFLAGPVLLLRVPTLIANLLPSNAGLEGRLIDALAILRAANKWQPITDYPDLKSEILYLAQIGKIDFSTAKGTPRIKAHLDL
jgi:hypothetical protein